MRFSLFMVKQHIDTLTKQKKRAGMTHDIVKITTVVYICYVTQQNSNVCTVQSVMCTCTHRIIYHRVFCHILCVITLIIILSTRVEKLLFLCNTTFV